MPWHVPARQDFLLGVRRWEAREPAEENSNATAIAEMREIFIRGDLGAFLARCSEDVVAHVAGNNSIRGTYRGKAEYAGYLGRLLEGAAT